MNSSFSCKQNGAALLISLMVLFIVTAISVAVTSDFQVLLRRTEYQLNNERNQPLFRAVESMARRLLLEDNKNLEEADYYAEAWASPFNLRLDNPSNEMTIHGQLYDIQGRFNINNLASSVEGPANLSMPNTLSLQQRRFLRLLQTLNVAEMTVSKATALTEAITDWLDADDIVSGLGGAEYEYYEELNPPIRPANKPIADISELRMIKGMTNEIYRALAPHITVWPLEGNSEINLNTATPQVLASLNNDVINEPLTEIEVQWLEDIRRIGRFPSLEIFKQGPFQNRNINLEQTGESSHYFLLIAEITQNNVKQYAHSVIYRDNSMAKVISRTFNNGGLPIKVETLEQITDNDEEFGLSTIEKASLHILHNKNQDK